MKKKGLIVATIVMVLVLAVSLTTATYAWFSSQASATVDDLQIQTVAAEGLQIAMLNETRTINNHQSGELTYNLGTNDWSGTQEGWGTYLGFSSVDQGSWADAVARVDADGKDANETVLSYHTGTYTKTNDGTAVDGKVYYVAKEAYGASDNPVRIKGTNYYTTADSGATYVKVTGDLVAGTVYYTIDEGDFSNTALEPDVETVNSAGFYKPTGYDANTQPNGYEQAHRNVHYYEFEMAITNTVGIYDLGMGIVVLPDTEAGNAKYPGMAAASRIELEFAKSTTSTKTGTISGNATTTLEPWGGYTLLSSNTWNGTGHGSYKIDLDGNQSDLIAAGEVWFITVRIWIEGTDNECDNFTAGTGFDVQIEFVFAKDADKDVTYNNTNNVATDTTHTVTFPA